LRVTTASAVGDFHTNSYASTSYSGVGVLSGFVGFYQVLIVREVKGSQGRELEVQLATGNLIPDPLHEPERSDLDNLGRMIKLRFATQVIAFARLLKEEGLPIPSLLRDNPAVSTQRYCSSQAPNGGLMSSLMPCNRRFFFEWASWLLEGVIGQTREFFVPYVRWIVVGWPCGPKV
jgi:hypothetical protein